MDLRLFINSHRVAKGDTPLLNFFFLLIHKQVPPKVSNTEIKYATNDGDKSILYKIANTSIF